MSSSNNRTEFFKKVISSLDSLTEADQFNRLSNIEVDLIKEKLRKIYDQVSGINKIEVMPQKDVEFEIEVEVKEENVISSIFVDEKIHQSETDLSEIELEELLPAATEGKEMDHEPAQSKDRPDLFSTSDNFREPESKTVVDAISEELKKESIADKIQKHARIESLKSAIGINEKFFFINELFDGNLNDYNLAIDSLDKINTMDELIAYFEILSVKYNWPKNIDAAEQLKQFAKRKLK